MSVNYLTPTLAHYGWHSLRRLGIELAPSSFVVSRPFTWSGAPLLPGASVPSNLAGVRLRQFY